MLISKSVVLAAGLATLLASAAFSQDPPSRVARLNYLSGNVSMQAAGVDDWAPAEINRPFTTGDTLYTDLDSRAEFHLDNAVVRAGESTHFGFLTLTDQAAQLSLTSGDLYVNVRELDPNQTFEVDSPNAAISILRPGRYRFRIASNGELTFVVVRQGQTEITGGGQAIDLTPGNSASISGSTELSYNVEVAPQPDEFDLWSQARDAREANLASARYLPRSVVGYEDLDNYGDWQDVGGYGHVWYPRAVVAGWAPYHNGHWAWIEPWGWTWVDEAPWGFAPFHYGRWAYVTGRWGWCPGPIVVVVDRPLAVRPVYAPALVAWFGGAHLGVSIHIGGGAPNLGWVPLGVGEVYTPAYHCSPHYFNNVNVSNTTVVKTVNITNVYNTVYVNKTVYNQRFVNVQAPNAVTAMPQAEFARGRNVRQAGTSVTSAQVRDLRPETATLTAPPVAPTRQAIVSATPANGGAVARPSAQLAARTVVVHNAPAPTPAPFAARQAFLQQHAGEPHDFNMMHRQVAAPVQQPKFVQARPVVPVAKTAAVVAQPHPQPAQPPQPAASVRPAIIQQPEERKPMAPPQEVHKAVAQPQPEAKPVVTPYREIHPPQMSVEQPALRRPAAPPPPQPEPKPVVTPHREPRPPQMSIEQPALRRPTAPTPPQPPKPIEAPRAIAMPKEYPEREHKVAAPPPPPAEKAAVHEAPHEAPKDKKPDQHDKK